jgi:hypothetical protein
MPEQLLKIASHIGYQRMVASFAVLVAASIAAYLLRQKETVLATIAAAAILSLGVAPLLASAILKSRGVYHIQVVVLRPDQTPVELAQVKSSTGAELRMDGSGWALDIPQQSRPADGKISFSASAKDEFLNGNSTLILAGDYYPIATIQTVAETSGILRGVVVDDDMTAVAGATVYIDGNSDKAVTDQKGNFVLPTRAGKGQLVEVKAKKGPLKGHISARAGKTAEIILSQQ